RVIITNTGRRGLKRQRVSRMGMDTNDLDTRYEDKARTEGRLEEFWEENQIEQDEEEDKL
ncbi:MAG: hypothetical protein WC373_14875, partial [Smithella sp.]